MVATKMNCSGDCEFEADGNLGRNWLFALGKTGPTLHARKPGVACEYS